MTSSMSSSFSILRAPKPVWGAQTRFHAARMYSWISPPWRSPRSTLAVGGARHGARNKALRTTGCTCPLAPPEPRPGGRSVERGLDGAFELGRDVDCEVDEEAGSAGAQAVAVPGDGDDALGQLRFDPQRDERLAVDAHGEAGDEAAPEPGGDEAVQRHVVLDPLHEAGIEPVVGEDVLDARLSR